MAEKNLDFDTVIDRRDTDSLKYDCAKMFGKPENILPLWVADMDFRISSYIQEAIAARGEHGIFGYSEPGEEYFEAVREWMRKRHNWKVDRKWLVKTPGVVYALAMAVKAYTKENDAVLIQQPVYHPFRNIVEDNDRRVVDNPLKQDGTGKYYMDFSDLEDKIVKEDVKLMLLCNPHNPVGRVWTKEELCQLGDICCRHKVIVVSDEIHADFVFSGKHQVFMDLKEEYKDITLTCTAPSKTFNIAGLQVSNIFIANKELRRDFRKQIKATGLGELNAMGLVACQAAYRDGEEWYQGMLSYIKGNISYLREYLLEHLPKVKMIEPEGTYLVWLDFRELGLNGKELDEFIIKKAGLWLNGGTIFGDEGEGFQRINVACPRSILKQALEQLRQAIERG